ncbi:hypothetical protein CHH73_21385, partial [Shouchella clausii]
ELFLFDQEPADHEMVTVTWKPEPVTDVTAIHVHAVMFHDDKLVHELNLQYKLYPSHYKTTPVSIGRPVAYIGQDQDFHLLSSLV